MPSQPPPKAFTRTTVATMRWPTIWVAVRWFAKQIDKLRAMGVHCSSSVIATLLRELAKP